MRVAGYTNIELEEAVRESRSYSEVLRRLGLRPGGGSHSHIKLRVARAKIDISHFRGQGWNAGGISSRRKTEDEIFVLLPEGSYRPKVKQLRRALTESGVNYQCRGCGLGPEWESQCLTLEVDHIDGNWLNNLRENLQFLCPNCHSQK